MSPLPLRNQVYFFQIDLTDNGPPHAVTPAVDTLNVQAFSANGGYIWLVELHGLVPSIRDIALVYKLHVAVIRSRMHSSYNSPREYYLLYQMGW